MNDAPDGLDQVVASVLASRSYGAICREFVARIAAIELRKRRSAREAAKATKNKLHQVAGAYLPRAMPYGRWLDDLQAASASGNRAEVRDACRRIMAFHASTSERLPILETFYQTTLAACLPVHSVLDLACGLHPLAIPWMPLALGCTYTAIDIYSDMMSFIDAWFAHCGVSGQAMARDVLALEQTQPVDLAFLLKVLPCLDQVSPDAGLPLLDGVNARHIVVSFPVRSLGGKNKGMAHNYETRFRALIEARRWPAQRFEFATELAFVVTKPVTRPSQEA